MKNMWQNVEPIVFAEVTPNAPLQWENFGDRHIDFID